MAKHIFLEGTRNVGKSTIIRDAVLPYIKDVGGFFSVKLLKNNEKIGFAVRPIKEAKEYVLTLEVDEILKTPGLFMYKKANEWNFLTDVFIDRATKYINEAFEKRLIIMDEIGGLELQNPDFLQKLTYCINGNIPILGVLKSNENLANMHEETGFDIENIDFIQQNLRKNKNIEILSVSEKNENEIKAIVNNFIKATFD